MPDDLSAAIRDLDLPAEGETLQQARDSVRSVYEFLDERGSATSGEIEAAIFPEYESSYTFAEETAESWFETYVAPGLEQLSAVERDGEEWRVRSR